MCNVKSKLNKMKNIFIILATSLFVISLGQKVPRTDDEEIVNDDFFEALELLRVMPSPVHDDSIWSDDEELLQSSSYTLNPNGETDTDSDSDSIDSIDSVRVDLDSSLPTRRVPVVVELSDSYDDEGDTSEEYLSDIEMEEQDVEVESEEAVVDPIVPVVRPLYSSPEIYDVESMDEGTEEEEEEAEEEEDEDVEMADDEYDSQDEETSEHDQIDHNSASCSRINIFQKEALQLNEIMCNWNESEQKEELSEIAYMYNKELATNSIVNLISDESVDTEAHIITKRSPFHDENDFPSSTPAKMPTMSHIKKRVLIASNKNKFQIEAQQQRKRTERIGKSQNSIDQIFLDLKMFKMEDISLPGDKYEFDSDSLSRQEVRIVEVVAQKSFNIENQITEWKSVENKAAGRGEGGLTLVTLGEYGPIIEKHEFSDHIASMAMFQSWVPSEMVSETILLLAQDQKINWFKFTDDNLLIQLWSWTLSDSIIHMNIFQTPDSAWKLAIIQENQDGSRYLCIYGMQLFENFWFEGKYEGSGSITVFDDGKYLATTQNDRKTVTIYKLDNDFKKYNVLKSFSSPNVESIVSFTAGTELFLAIGGDNSGIYLVNNDEFVPQTIHEIDIDHVELWLPISVDDFWDSTVLLFQHKLDHESHSSSILEALQWIGNGFKILDHSPCNSHEEEMFGFSCILDAEGERGIKGAAIIRNLQNKNNILTASEEYSPILFEVHTEMIEIPNPHEVDKQEVLDMKKRLEERLIKQQRILERAKSIIKIGIPKNQDQFAAEGWKIKELRAPIVKFDGNLKDFINRDGEVLLGGLNLLNVDYNLKMNDLFDEIKENHNKISKLIYKIENSVTRTDDITDLLHDIIIKGGITVGGKVQIENAHFDYINDVKVDDVLKTAEKIPQSKELNISGKKEADYLWNSELSVKKINDIEISNPRLQNSPILVNGDIELLNFPIIKENVMTSENGKINNIDFKTDLYLPNIKLNYESPQPLYFESVVVKNGLSVEKLVNGFDFTERGFKKLSKEYEDDNYEEVRVSEIQLKTLRTDRNLYFDSINGRNWNDYINNVIFTNRNFVIDELVVEGELSSEGSASFRLLNDLAFPDDYYLPNDERDAVFTAPKTFLNGIVVDEIDCEDTINDIDPRDIVTLNTKQTLDNFTFLDLTISERMNIDGEIIGKDLDKFLNNPKITETNVIDSNTIFRNLKVEGNVVVKNQFNKTDLKNLLQDVIMKNNGGSIVIDSMKVFEGNVNADKGVTIQSGFINERRLSDLLTLNTDQDIDVENIGGDIKFKNIQVDGMFDRVNLTDLIENSVKLNENQVIDAELVFDNEDEVEFNLEVENIQVIRTCNDWDVKTDAIDITKENIVLQEVEFENLIVDELIVKGNLNTFNSISGISLAEFDYVRLSKSEDRTVSAPLSIGNCSAENVFFKYVNNYSIEEIKRFVAQMKNLKEEILSGNIAIGTLHVKGKLNTDIINNRNIRQLSEEAIWLKNDENKDIIPGKITFVDDVYFDELKIEGNVFGMDFENHFYDIVKKSEQFVHITGNKIFQSGLTIRNFVNLTQINNIPVHNLLNSGTEQAIRCPIYVNGSVFVDTNLEVHGMIDGVSLRDASRSLQMLGDNKYQHIGDLQLNENSYIENLVIEGLVNDQYDLNQFLKSAVRKDSQVYFEQPVIFTGEVTMLDKLEIKYHYNGFDLREISNVVTIQEDAEIYSAIQFLNPVFVEKSLIVAENTNCNFLQNCDVQEWIENSINVKGQQHIPQRKVFNNIILKGNLHLDFLNDYDMNKIIYLNNDQYIKDAIFVENLYTDSNITVNHLFNSLRLEDGLGNILQVNGNQTIESPILFHSNVIVNNSLTIKNINAHNFENIVRLNMDQVLSGNYQFLGENHFKSNVNISGTLSNINLDLWLQNAVYKQQPHFQNSPQVLRGNWDVSGKIHFHGNVSGKGSLGSIQVESMKHIAEDKSEPYKKRQELLVNYFKTLCKSVNEFARLANNKVNLFENLIETQKIESGESVTHLFTHGTEDFIVLTKNMSCVSEIWKLNQDTLSFGYYNEFESGCSTEWYSMNLDRQVYLLAQARQDCSCRFKETEVFGFDGINLQHISSLPSLDSVHVSKPQGTFYGLNNGKIEKYTIPQNPVGSQVVISLEVGPEIGKDYKFLPYKLKMIISDKNSSFLIKLHQNKINLEDIHFEDQLILSADELIDFTVGLKSQKLTAAVWTNIEIEDSSFSMIKIYKDIYSGEVYQTIPAYKPSSLQIIQLDNRQTLLLFAENNEKIQVYLYKGFAGFSHIFEMEMTGVRKLDMIRESKILVATTNNSITILGIKMLNNQIKIDNIPCYL